jgi:heme A synthase
MSLRKLAVASTVATFLLIGIGGLVRATKSGLGCGEDWPACNGKLVPAMQTYTTLVEWLHRLAALAVVVLLGILLVVAYRSHRHRRRLLAAATVAFGLVVLQALVGMVVVKLRLEAVSVVLHLGLALALAALLIHIFVAAARVEGKLQEPADPVVARSAWLAAAAVLVLLLVGSYVRGIGAGNVFPDWPLMNGHLVPDLSGETHAFHFLHRALAVVAGVVIAYVAVQIIGRKSDLPAAARLVQAAAGMFAVEVVLGAANVWTDVDSPAVRTLHLFTGVLVWGCLTAVAAVSGRRVEQAVDRARAPAKVALEGQS